MFRGDLCKSVDVEDDPSSAEKVVAAENAKFAELFALFPRSYRIAECYAGLYSIFGSRIFFSIVSAARYSLGVDAFLEFVPHHDNSIDGDNDPSADVTVSSEGWGESIEIFALYGRR